MVLAPSKKYPETGIRKIYGRKSVRITNLLLVFPDTSCLGQVLLGWQKVEGAKAVERIE